MGASGSAGVDVFFALSGFLITSLLLRERSGSGTIDLRAFYIRRVLRLVPALVVVVAGVVGLALVSGHLESVLPGAVATLLYLSNWWNYSSGHETPLLEHTWTLSIEEHFYFVWPIILIGLVSARRWARSLGITAIAVICALHDVRMAGVLGWGATVLSSGRPPCVRLCCRLHREATSLAPAAAGGEGVGTSDSVHPSGPSPDPSRLEDLPMAGPASVPGILSALLVLSLVTAPGTLTSRVWVGHPCGGQVEGPTASIFSPGR